MKSLMICLALACGVFYGSAQGSTAEVEGVKAACYDYVNAFYNADPSLAYRSVHPTVRKTGFHFNAELKTYSEQLEMPFEQLVSLAKSWNSTGQQADENTPKEVEVFEVADKTAMAKVTAVWGIDYISLMKTEGKWMIVNVLWQSPPKYTLVE